jgi:DNA-binding LytR/AlgR family response regulator
MNIMIIEDEPMAAERLEELIRKADPSANVVGKCDSVKKSVKWFREHPQPDLLFLDIQLGDGISFEIFEQVSVNCPVIFTTAYDAYAIDAFRVNSIAYLLKPVKMEELARAIEKYKTSPYFTRSASLDQQFALEKVQQLLTGGFKRRFIVRTGVHIKSVPVEGILYFYSLEKATYATTTNGKNHLLDYALDHLEDMLDPTIFFRINRKYIVSLAAIQDMVTYSNYRLKLVLRNCSDDDVFVSRERMQHFKNWLDK